MKTARKFAVVLVTTPDLKVARKLARLALEARVVACANVVPRIESHYWWKGEIECSPEVLIVFKTQAALLERLEVLILKHHPYDTPEVLALSPTQGTPRYLDWLTSP